MSTISKANKPRKKPGMTRNDKPRLRALSVNQLEEMLLKSSTPKLKDKIKQEINRQKHKNLPVSHSG